MARHDPQTLEDLRPGRRRATDALRAVVGGAAGAWLGSEVLLVALALRPDVGPLTVADVASALTAIAWLTGIASAVLAPVAALLALVARRARGGGALACGLVGAVGGVAVVQVLGASGPRITVIGAGLGAVCGLAGWAASARARSSSTRVAVLLATAAGVWAAALLTVAPPS